MRVVVRCVAGAALLVLSSACAAPLHRAPTSAEARPDVVLLIADDLRADVLGPAGHPTIRTPHIARLAAEGAWFDNAFVVSPQCSPSRATILSGTHLHVHGVHDNGARGPFAAVTFAALLRKAGYETAFIGKWHISEQWEPRPEFDHWVALRGQGEYFDAELNVDGAVVASRGYSTDVLSEYAVRWLERDRARPQLLILALKSVHRPLEPAPRHARLWQHAPIPLPASFDDAPDDPSPRARGVDPHLREGSAAELREEIRAYWRMVPAVDDSVGLLLRALERRRMLPHTAFLLTSDSGFLLGEHGLELKSRGYDPALRVPFVLRYPPRVPAGVRLHGTVLNLDIAPTLLDLAGVAPPAAIQGRSVMALLDGRAERLRERWLYVQPFARDMPGAVGLRSERWKYLYHPKGERAELLFDLAADPDERRDLAGDPGHAADLRELRAGLRELLVEHAAPAEWGPPAPD